MRFSTTDQLDKRGFTKVCCIGCNEKSLKLNSMKIMVMEQSYATRLNRGHF